MNLKSVPDPIEDKPLATGHDYYSPNETIARLREWLSNSDAMIPIEEVESALYWLLNQQQSSSLNPFSLNHTAQLCHEISVSKGFYDPPPEFFERIVHMHGELSEAYEEHRDGRGYAEIYFKTDKQGNQKPEGIPIEFADTMIRMLDASAYYGIDIEQAIKLKMEYNKSRPHMHGRVR